MTIYSEEFKLTIAKLAESGRPTTELSGNMGLAKIRSITGEEPTGKTETTK